MSTSTKNSTTKRVDVKRNEAESTASVASSTGSAVTSKVSSTQVKTSKSRIQKPDSDDEADEDYMTYLRSRNWSKSE